MVEVDADGGVVLVEVEVGGGVVAEPGVEEVRVELDVVEGRSVVVVGSSVVGGAVVGVDVGASVAGGSVVGTSVVVGGSSGGGVGSSAVSAGS